MKALTAPSVDLYWDAVAAGDGFEDHRAPLDVIPQAQIFDAEDLTDAKEVRGLAKMMCGPWWRHMHLSCTVISGDLARLIRFREDLDYCEDFDFFWRICEAAERAATSNAPGVARGEGDNQWHGLEMTDRRYALEKFSMFSLLQNLERSSPVLDEHDRDLLRRRLQVYREQFYWAQIARLKSRRLPNLDLWARWLARDPQLAGLAASLAFKVNRNGGRTIIPEDA